MGERMDKEETEHIAEEIADEIVETVSNKLKNLEKRIENLEGTLKEHVSDSNTIAIESERMITERYEKLKDEIIKLRDIIPKE